jgi:hypothetical protein
MSRGLCGDAIEYVVSLVPEDVVRHCANAQKELLLAMEACVVRGVREAVEEIDRLVAGAEKRREARAREGERNSTRITIEEESATT